MKKIIYLIISATLALCAFNAQAADDYQACFYQHANFQGAETCYTGTTVRIPFVGNDLNDQFSSVKVGQKVTVTIFRDGNYNGGSEVYESNISFLNDFNDEISSLTLTETAVRPSANQICFYQDANYQGAETCYTGTARIPFVGNDLNDQFSSLKIGNKVTAIIFRDGNYNGGSEVHESNISFLNDFNDEISSLTLTERTINPSANRPTANQACFYSESYYRGKGICYSAQDIPSLGENANFSYASSLYGANVTTVRTYTSANFRGRNELAAQGQGIFRPRKALSSIKIKTGSFRENGNRVCFYSPPQRGFKEFCYTGSRDVPNLGSPSANNFVYVKVPNGYQARVYNAVNFRGIRTTFESATGYLPTKHTNLVSSIKIKKSGDTFSDPAFDPNGNQVCFYTQTFHSMSGGFTGREFCYSGAQSLSALGRARNSFRSVKIPRGWRVRVYNGRGFTRERSNIYRTTRLLPGVHLGNIESIQIIRNN
jgi:uncharacterized protein with FMN-binding domain